MKFIKLINSVVLALALCLSCSGIVMADIESDTNDTEPSEIEVTETVETTEPSDSEEIPTSDDQTPSKTQDPIENFVERLYKNMLGRDFDEEGLRYWADALAADELSGNEIADSFYFSAEFEGISEKASDDEFVKIMYDTFFGREADCGGLKYWVDSLSDKINSRDDVYKAFLSSDEWSDICKANKISVCHYNVEDFVKRLYSNILGRDADVEGMNFWVNELKSLNRTAATVAYGFFDSEEYLASNKSDDSYCKDLYATLMGRKADEAGMEYWLKVLSDGESRGFVFNKFATSAEFTEICEKYGVIRGDEVTIKKNITVCIDPGHSKVMPAGTCPMGPGSSIGKPADAVGTHGSASGLMEYELTLSIGMQLKDELESRGYDVIMTRTDGDKAYDLVYRAEVANDNADIMVRIHADGLDNTSITGCSAIIITPSNPWNPQTYTGSKKLADNLISNYIAQTGIRNRGVVQEDTMAGNNWSTVPCVLFELGFMTNRAEDLKMADSSFQKQMVTGLANGVDAYFDN